LPRHEPRAEAGESWSRLRVQEDHGAGAASRYGLRDDQVAKGALLGRTMTMVMPSHAESGRHQQGDQHNRDYQTPKLRSVGH
jgi:hypothetical protein